MDLIAAVVQPQSVGPHCKPAVADAGTHRISGSCSAPLTRYQLDPKLGSLLPPKPSMPCQAGKAEVREGMACYPLQCSPTRSLRTMLAVGWASCIFETIQRSSSIITCALSARIWTGHLLVVYPTWARPTQCSYHFQERSQLVLHIFRPLGTHNSPIAVVNFPPRNPPSRFYDAQDLAYQ